MNWWDEQDTQRQDRLNAMLDSEDGSEYLAYAHGEREFAAWLVIAEVICFRRHGVSIFDLADWTWRDAYDNDTTPNAALREALEFDGTYGNQQ